LRMRSSLANRASDCQCTSCNGPGFDPSIRRHSGIWGAADEAVLNKVLLPGWPELPFSLHSSFSSTASPRETREGWPLLTVETQVNGGSKRTNERVPFLVDSLGLSCRYKIFMFCLGCSSRPSRKYFFLTIHYFSYFVPITQQAGQTALLGRLSLSVCLLSLLWLP
jgi:hypothetical protein